MNITRKRLPLFGRMLVLSLLALVALSSLGSAPTLAQGQAPAERQSQALLSPHTPVSNTGVLAAAAPRGATSAVQGYAGTGAAKSGLNTFALDFGIRPAVSATPMTVIGADGRYQITGTTAYPYRAVVHITSSIGGCSGWMISDDTVATAGHCIHGTGWASNVRVYPGRNGSSTPYGSCSGIQLFSVVGWTQNKNRNYDYGAIKLNCTIGNTVGWFGFRWTSASLTGQPSYTAGYPGDKPYATQWRSNDSVRISQTYRLYYANDTYNGQSGSAVWNNEAGCSTCSIAIHAYGVDSTGYNGGTRITESVFNNLLAWR